MVVREGERRVMVYWVMMPLAVCGAVNRISIELEERLVSRGGGTPSGAVVNGETKGEEMKLSSKTCKNNIMTKRKKVGS